MRKGRRAVFLLVSLATLLTIGKCTLLPAPRIYINATAAAIVDINSGQLLYQQNADCKLPTASLAKIMTLLLAMEEISTGKVNLSDMVKISGRAALTTGSKAWLAAGEYLPLKQLIQATLIASANDAAVALAEHLAGNEQAFVDRMNQRATTLGLKNTRFVNSNGLPLESGQEGYSTANDMALLATALINFREIIEWSSMKSMLFREKPQQILYNTNPILGTYPGCDGLKTGSTDAAGYHLVATARQGNRRLLSVVMQASTRDVLSTQTALLLDYGFSLGNNRRTMYAK